MRANSWRVGVLAVLLLGCAGQVLAAPAESIAKTKVVTTMVAGKVVYTRAP